jgi:hypothetical protein
MRQIPSVKTESNRGDNERTTSVRINRRDEKRREEKRRNNRGKEEIKSKDKLLERNNKFFRGKKATSEQVLVDCSYTIG